MQAPQSHARLWEPWTDYSTGRSQFQFTATELGATFAVAAASVTLAFAGLFVFRIILSSLHGLTFLSIKYFYDEHESNVRDGDDEEAQQPLLAGSIGDLDDGPGHDYGTLATETSTGSSPSDQSMKEHRVRKFFHRLITGGGVVLTLVWAIAAILWAILVVHTVGFVFTENDSVYSHIALWNSSSCGLYEPTASEGNTSAIDMTKAQRAASYAKSCYPHESTTSPGASCDFFTSPYIGNDEKCWNTCPFADVTACLNHEWTPFVNFDTLQGHDVYGGSMKRYIYKEALDLGINTAKPWRWKRGTSCVPLSVEVPYVTSETDEEGVTTYFYKHLQPVDNSSDFAWSTRGDPFEQRQAEYQVKAFTTHYNLTLHNETFKSHPGIGAWYQSRLTVIYISAGRILYTSPSTDPLFPADEPYVLDNITYWRKSDPRATALACADMAEVCDDWFCQHISEPFSWREDRESKEVELWWLKHALQDSSAYHAVKGREGEALLANEVVKDGVSEGLAEDQWIKEARWMFNTSLSHAQFAVWDIADGAGRDEAGYVDKTPPAFKHDLCRSFKFRAEGTRNVPIWPLVLCILAWPVAFVLSWRVERIRLGGQGARDTVSRYFGGKASGSRNGKDIARSAQNGHGEASASPPAVQDTVHDSPHRSSSDAAHWDPLLFHWLFVLGPLYLARLGFSAIMLFLVGHVAIVHRVVSRKGWPVYSVKVYEWMAESARDVVWWLGLLFA